MLAKITRGHQITIGREIVRQAHLKEGDYLDIRYENGVIRLKAVEVEERVPEEAYEALLKKAAAMEPGDVKLSAKKAAVFLKNRRRS